MNLELEDFEIVGISVRTTNQNGQSKKDISTLWERFSKDESVAKIEHKITDDLYCVYTDYERDDQGGYEVVLGYQRRPGTVLPSGCIRKVILRSRYQVYITQGPLPQAIQQTWKEIWKADLKRKYMADFDVYGPYSKDPEYAIVRTFVSIE